MQAADTIRIVPCFEGGGKLRNKFSVKVIHTATVHIVSFGILAHGFPLDIPFSEICAVAFKYHFEAVVQKRQVLFENIKVGFTGYADIPFLRHAHRVIFTLASIDPFMEDDHLTAGIYVGNDSDNVNILTVVPLVKAGEYSSVMLLCYGRSFRFFLKLYHKM